jgi:DNA-binding response OmpR family regulator
MNSEPRLLLIEDDFDVAEMLEMYFGSHGYDVRHADTGEEGIELARTTFPNLILLDVVLPDMDGYDICVKLRHRSLTKYIPIIFLTQRDERASKVRGLELGADDYITKPFDIDELRLRIQGSIRRATRESLHEARTGLPTGLLVDEERRRCRKNEQNCTELAFQLDGSETYQNVYGFVAANAVMSHAAKMIKTLIGQQGTADDFVGINEDVFIVVTFAQDATTLKEAITTQFAEEVRVFYSFADAERGGILLDAGKDTERVVPMMRFVSVDPARESG